MIKIENVETYGWKAAIRGARNPMNSWDKSDSATCDKLDCNKCPHDIGSDQCDSIRYEDMVIGHNDHRLLTNLANAGPDHGKFLRMITVTLDITAPLYWWKEFDTYKVGTVANSCSTMHKIHSKEFTLEDFSHEHLDEPDSPFYRHVFDAVLDGLNTARNLYLETKEKIYWWQMIQLLPTSYNQRRTVQLNYQVLKSMYHARLHHKLDEWREFCSWVKTLPYAELIANE